MSDVEKEKTINLGKVNQTKLKLNWKKVPDEQLKREEYFLNHNEYEGQQAQLLQK